MARLWISVALMAARGRILDSFSGGSSFHFGSVHRHLRGNCSFGWKSQTSRGSMASSDDASDPSISPSTLATSLSAPAVSAASLTFTTSRSVRENTARNSPSSDLIQAFASRGLVDRLQASAGIPHRLTLAEILYPSSKPRCRAVSFANRITTAGSHHGRSECSRLTSQTSTVASSLAVARSFPSGVKARELTLST